MKLWIYTGPIRPSGISSEDKKFTGISLNIGNVTTETIETNNFVTIAFNSYICKN